MSGTHSQRRIPHGAPRTRGSPRDPGNPWPEPHYGSQTAYTKDGVETKLKNAVCAGTITLSSARTAIKTNWTTALQVTGIGRMSSNRSRVKAMLAACATAAATVFTAGPASAAGTFSLQVYPDQSHTGVYDFINSATRSIDMTMYELRDTTAVSDLVNRKKAGTVRVILAGAHTCVNSSTYSALQAAGVGVTYSSTAFVYTHQKSAGLLLNSRTIKLVLPLFTRVPLICAFNCGCANRPLTFSES